MKVNTISNETPPAPDRRTARAENRRRRRAARLRAAGTATLSTAVLSAFALLAGPALAAGTAPSALNASAVTAVSGYRAPYQPISVDTAAVVAFARSQVLSVAAPTPEPPALPDPDKKLFELLTMSSGKPDDEQRKGTLAAPLAVLNPSSPFGDRISPINPDTHDFHRGQDFAAKCGTDVLASAAGTVVFADVHKFGGGNRVEIEHPTGLKTTYNHLESFTAKVGDEVKRGDVIAKIGSTGASTGCHLHFEVYLGKEVVDPLGWL